MVRAARLASLSTAVILAACAREPADPTIMNPAASPAAPAPTPATPPAAPAPTLPLIAPTTCSDDAAGGPTLAVTRDGWTLDGQPLADPAALRAALRERAGKPSAELALAIDGELTLAALRPLLIELSAADLPLFVTVRTADGPPRHLPLAAVEYDPQAQAEVARRIALDLHLDAYNLHLDRVPDRLQTAAGVDLPLGTTIPATGRLRVIASDLTSWSIVAAALARGCQDTRLVDPTLAVPPPSAAAPSTDTPTPSGPQGTLDRDIIRRIVRAHINEVRHCYNQALARDPNAKGRVVVHFQISPEGKVRDASVTESTMRDPAVAACITAAVGRWTFPKPEGGGSVDLTYPFVLEPG